MSLDRLIVPAVCIALLVGCQETTGPDFETLTDGETPSLHGSRYHKRDIHVRGAGKYVIESLDIDVKFRLWARMGRYGHASGRFHQSLRFEDQLVSFDGRVTCLAYDRKNGRLWVGGVVTRNRSEHPAFTTELNEPGKDVWFRVLDTRRKSGEPDRSTFMGFEGSAGIITSAEYCEARIWPGPPEDDENARTNPFTRGGLRIW